MIDSKAVARAKYDEAIQLACRAACLFEKAAQNICPIAGTGVAALWDEMRAESLKLQKLYERLENEIRRDEIDLAPYARKALEAKQKG
jgi:hypothetical protein